MTSGAVINTIDMHALPFNDHFPCYISSFTWLADSLSAVPKVAFGCCCSGFFAQGQPCQNTEGNHCVYNASGEIICLVTDPCSCGNYDLLPSDPVSHV